MLLFALNVVFLVLINIYLTNGSQKQLVMFFAFANCPIIACRKIAKFTFGPFSSVHLSHNMAAH